jgi:large subunit ribosomal protein L30
MSQILVTQVKSSIGGTAGQRNTLRSLGLKHVGDSVMKDDRPEFRGMVATVAHLVTVQEVQ